MNASFESKSALNACGSLKTFHSELLGAGPFTGVSSSSTMNFYLEVNIFTGYKIGIHYIQEMVLNKTYSYRKHLRV